MSAAVELGRVAEKLARLRRVVEARAGGVEAGRLLRLIDECVGVLERVRAEMRVDLPELARSLSRRVDRLLSAAGGLPRGANVFYEELHSFCSYLRASYYDFTSKLGVVRRGYRLYVFSTVVAMVLMPIFFRVGLFLLGVYVLGLLISIHAFRARRKLGPLIAAALLPLALFTSLIALRYSIYALTTPGELARMVSESGLSPGTAKLLLAGIAAASAASTVSGFYALYTIARHMDAFT